MQAAYRMVVDDAENKDKNKSQGKSEGGDANAGETVLNAAELLLSVVEKSDGMVMMPKQFEKA